MATLSESALASLLAPYLHAPVSRGPERVFSSEPIAALVGTQSLYRSLSVYLDLLLKWNDRTNLTAIRDPEQIVTRHFGESVFASRCVGSVLSVGRILDFGSGAGFPGIPLQICLPTSSIILAESQGKKAAFLRAAVRELEIPAEVWGARVAEMPAESHFDLVAMRAVDDPEKARAEAWGRVRHGGHLLEMTTSNHGPDDQCHEVWSIPGTRDGIVSLRRKA